MRVLLVNPPTLDGVRYVREGRCEQKASSYQYLMVPISLPSIAAVLREDGHEVRLVDCVASGQDAENLVADARSWRPGLIVMNVSTPTFASDVRVAAMLSAACQAHVTAYGVHVTALPDESLDATPFDSVVRGEPEYTVRDLARQLPSLELACVDGLSHKSLGSIVHNPPRPFIDDLDALPFPARDLLDNAKYTAPLSTAAQTLIVSERGCPHACTYCTAHCYYGHRVRRRSPSNIADEIEECVKRFGIRSFVMWADTFTSDKQHVLAVCDEIESRRLEIDWQCNSRVDTVDAEILKRMGAAGCSAVSFGVESGVQEILDAVRKGTTLQQAVDAFGWAREAGITTLAYVILGLPGETRSTIRQTRRFIRQLDPDFVQIHCAVPFPGTELRARAIADGVPVADSWQEYEIDNAAMGTAELTARDLDRARVSEFLRFYLQPRRAIRALGSITRRESLARVAKWTLDFLGGWVRPRH